jgi:hypothetical protein
MTHVAEHLGHAAAGPPEGCDRLGVRSAGRREPPPHERPEPKEKQDGRRDADLPPPLPPE